MGAMFYSEPFNDVVAAKLKMQMEIISGGITPRSMGCDVDALDLVKRTRREKDNFQSLVLLLNPDGEGGWQQRAQGYAKKIIIRFVCRGELDDDSMAGLLRLPQTTSAASAVLWRLYWYLKDYKKQFSSTHGETMKTLLSLLYDDTVATNRRSDAIRALAAVLECESEGEILSVARKWVEFLGSDTSPTLQIAVAKALHVQSPGPFTPSRTGLIAGECPGILEGLLMVLAEGKDARVRVSAVDAICGLSSAAVMAVRIASIPGALEKLVHAFLSEPATCFSAGRTLVKVSSVVENRTKFKGVEAGLKGLVELSVTGNLSFEAEIRRLAATILGNLALEEELRETILGMSGRLVERMLLIIQTPPELDDFFAYHFYRALSRALKILDPTLTTVLPPSPPVCYTVYMGRADAQRDMGMFLEALLDVLLAYLEYLLYSLWCFMVRHAPPQPTFYWEKELSGLRKLRMFLQAMLKDYLGAMVEANTELETCRNRNGHWGLADAYEQRGVLQRLSGNLAQALPDLDEALKLLECTYPVWFSRKYRFLMHRGFVKHLMGDDAGARADAESAQELKLNKVVWEETHDALELSELPLSYLGFTL